MSKKKKQSYYSSFLDRLNEIKGPSKDEIQERLGKTVEKAKKWTDEKSEKIDEWRAQKSSLIAGDRLDRLKNSGNPLMILEIRKVSPV